MGETEDILISNAEEYFKNALEAQNKGEFNTSVTLFFKTMSALCDLFILRKEGNVPSSHANRFRILETKYKDVYNLIDKDFPFYQESYKTRLTKEISFILFEDVKKISKIVGISL